MAQAISTFKVGNALKNLEEHHLAEKFCKQCLDLRPDYAAAHNEYGEVLAKQGKYEEAEGFFRSALKLDYFLAPAYLNLCSLSGGEGFHDFRFMQDMLENFNGDQEEIQYLNFLSTLN